MENGDEVSERGTGIDQGVRNRRERQLTRFALPYDYTCFADGTPFYIYKILYRAVWFL